MRKKIKIPLSVESLQSEGFHIFIQVRMDKKKIRMLVDTGASKTVFDKTYIAANFNSLTMEASEQLTTGIGTNTIESEFTVIPVIRLGKLKIKKLHVAILDFNHINETYSKINFPSIHGVIGCDLLMKYKAVINFKKSEMVMRK